MLTPLLYAVYTYNCIPSHLSNMTVKFAEDTKVPCLISESEKKADREEVQKVALSGHMGHRSSTYTISAIVYVLRNYWIVMKNGALVPKPSRVRSSGIVLVEKPHYLRPPVLQRAKLKNKKNKWTTQTDDLMLLQGGSNKNAMCLPQKSKTGHWGSDIQSYVKNIITNLCDRTAEEETTNSFCGIS